MCCLPPAKVIMPPYIERAYCFIFFTHIITRTWSPRKWSGKDRYYFLHFTEEEINSDCEPLAVWFRRTKPGTSWDLKSPVALPSTGINGKPSLVWLPKNYSIGMELTQQRSAQLPSTTYCTGSRKSNSFCCAPSPRKASRHILWKHVKHGLKWQGGWLHMFLP